jgi:tripartite ATP-independent transporter DctM subunit
MSLSELIQQKYDTRFSLAAIITAGTLVALIPPSTPVLIFCLLTGVSVGRALVAGIIPGIALTLVLVLVILVEGKIHPHKIPVADVEITWRQRFSSLTTLWPILVLFLVIIGGIYAGVFPPTVGGAVGASAALIYALLRRVDRRKITDAFKETVAINCQVFPIIISGFMFARLTALSGLADYLTQLVVGLQVPPLVVMAVVVVFYIIISFPLDLTPAMVITLPIFFPLLTALGFSPWVLCVVLTLMATLAAFTPPTGVTVYVAASIAKENVWGIWRAIIPWFIIMFAFLWLIILVPQLSTWLPNLMYK